jgi:hypothetical protein
MKACWIERQDGVGDRESSAVALEAATGPKPHFRSGAPSIIWRDESFGEVGGDPLSQVRKTDSH